MSNIRLEQIQLKYLEYMQRVVYPALDRHERNYEYRYSVGYGGDIVEVLSYIDIDFYDTIEACEELYYESYDEGGGYSVGIALLRSRAGNVLPAIITFDEPPSGSVFDPDTATYIDFLVFIEPPVSEYLNSDIAWYLDRRLALLHRPKRFIDFLRDLVGKKGPIRRLEPPPKAPIVGASRDQQTASRP